MVRGIAGTARLCQRGGVNSTRVKALAHPLQHAFSVSFCFVSAICVAWFVTVVVDHFSDDFSLIQFGILPRSFRGVIGVFLSPFLHGSAMHLWSNAVPLLVLLTLLFWNVGYRPTQTLTLIWIGSGAGTWLIGGNDELHIGASGVVYGLVAYLIAAGFLMRNWRSAVVAIVVFFLYGGIVWGVLPLQEGMSWEGHLCGAVAGAWAARKAHR